MRNNGAVMNPAAWAGAIVKLEVRDRARVLGRLLGLVGPLAMAVLGGGAFAKYLRFARQRLVPVALEDAGRATEGQIQELVRYVRQSHPDVLSERGVLRGRVGPPTRFCTLQDG